VSAASTPEANAPAAVGLDDLVGAVGHDLGRSDWTTIEAARLAEFALATGAPPPEPGQPAPPMFVLALTNLFLPQLLEVRGADSGVNYGAGEIRFPAAVRVGDRVRAWARIVDAVEVASGVQTTIEIRVEVDGGTEPACVVQSLSRWTR
jgi:acyl dehydratase